MVQIRH